MNLWRIIVSGPFGKALAGLCAALAIWAAGYFQGATSQRLRGLAEAQSGLIEQAVRIEKTLLEAADRTTARLHDLQTLQSELKSYETSLDGACGLSVDDAERLRGF